MKDYVVVLVPEITGAFNRNIVLPDGTCNKCLKKVRNNRIVACRMCKEKFHATGCCKGVDVCSVEFLSMHQKLSEEMGKCDNNAPGTFAFICNPCINMVETVQTTDSNNNDQYCCIEQIVDDDVNNDTDSDINIIKVDNIKLQDSQKENSPLLMKGHRKRKKPTSKSKMSSSIARLPSVITNKRLKSRTESQGRVQLRDSQGRFIPKQHIEQKEVVSRKARKSISKNVDKTSEHTLSVTTKNNKMLTEDVSSVWDEKSTASSSQSFSVCVKAERDASLPMPSASSSMVNTAVKHTTQEINEV